VVALERVGLDLGSDFGLTVSRVGTGWSGPRFLFSETWPV
jgi:hypothetical protein